MKKTSYSIVTFLLAMFLMGCEQLTQLTLSEQEINQYIAESIKYEKNLNISGLVDTNIVLSDVKIQIGRQEPNKITLSGKADIKLNSIFGNQIAVMQITLKSLPYFDKANGAIYLKEMELVNYSIEPQSADSTLKLLTPYLSQSLGAYFDLHPVYVINPDKGRVQALAKELAKGLEIRPGEIVIPFNL